MGQCAAIIGLIMALGSTATADVRPLAERADAVRPLLIGQRIPDASVRTIEGETVQLATLLAEQPTVLVFFRGGWCPFCNRQLAQLRLVKAALGSAGYRIIALSPDPPRDLIAAAKKNALDYTLLSDEGGEAARRFGLAYQAGPADFGGEALFGQWRATRSPAVAAATAWLPVPAVYLVHRSGLVVYQYVNVDFRVRLSAEVLLTAARAYGEAG